MEERNSIKFALENTEILYEPAELLSTSKKTTLHYFVLAEPYYLEEFPEEGPETKVREGEITWEKPKLLTPEYLVNMEGFSVEAKNAMQILAHQQPDLAGLMYKMNYKKKYIRTFTISKDIQSARARIEADLKKDETTLTVIIKGIDELWDVSLLKFIQKLMVKSAYKSQMPDYEEQGFLSTDEQGYSVVTRNLEGLPIAASEEIEDMFVKVKSGDLDPSRLQQELDRWGVFKTYQDRFFDLFRED